MLVHAVKMIRSCLFFTKPLFDSSDLCPRLCVFRITPHDDEEFLQTGLEISERIQRLSLAIQGLFVWDILVHIGLACVIESFLWSVKMEIG